MGDYAYNFEDGSDVISVLRSGLSELEDELSSLDSAVRSGMAKWTGSQRDAYDSAKADWDNTMMQMHEQLDQGHTALSGVNDIFSQNESTSRGLWSKH